MKKGQITMEALLLYGAAILVVLLAVAALIYFGVLDLGVFLPEKCSFAGTGSLNCEDWKIDYTNDDVIVEVTNKGTKSLEIVSGNFVSKDTGLTGVGTGGVTDCPLAGGSIVLAPNSAPTTLTFGCPAIVNEAGKKVSGKIELTTRIGGGSLTHAVSGDLTASTSP
jgi:hypothetical protein